MKQARIIDLTDPHPDLSDQDVAELVLYYGAQGDVPHDLMRSMALRYLRLRKAIKG